MSTFDAYPLGKPAFVTHILDRAAHFRTNDDKLFALEGQGNARAYVVYRDSLVTKQEESGPRALLTIKEALDYGANPGTIFLGLRDGAPVFGMGISPAAAEKLVGRSGDAVRAGKREAPDTERAARDGEDLLPVLDDSDDALALPTNAAGSDRSPSSHG